MDRRPVFNPPLQPQASNAPDRLARLTRRRGRLLTLMVSLAALASFGGVIYWAHEQDLKSGGEGIIPLIRADDKPIKIKPDTPGGMVVPDQDKTVYDRIAPGSVASGPEKLLPPAPVPQIPPAVPPQAMPTVPPPPAPAPAAQTDPTPPAAPAPPAAQATAPPAALTPAAPVPATPAAAPAPAAAPVAAPAGQSIASLIDTVSGYRIQLASVRSEEQAQATWARMQKTNADVLASLTMRAIKVDLGDRGTYYRVQAGPLDESGATLACSKLKGRSVDCIVVKP
jgi:pyruvate/2-oxoglutarate dehydrogenase complex dihydrolipoamide acyltransferase (E2) component